MFDYNHCKKFDLDLSFGEIYEEKLRYIFGNKKIEVKTERDIWKATGNICIELEYRKQFSGINITRADFWCHILQDNGDIKAIFIFPVEELRNIVKDCLKNNVAKLEYGGDDKESLIALIPIKNLLDINY